MNSTLMRHTLVALVLASTVSAQEARDTARATAVIVTATRVPLTKGALPVAVTVIDGAELRTRGVTTVADALMEVTSAYVAQTGSQGGTAALFLRGGESKYVKVLVDGIPANDPGGAFDFASLTTDNVERIEVVRGPASVIYGADAVTGVVNVITRRGREGAHTEVAVRQGASPRSETAPGVRPAPVRNFDASAAISGSVATSAGTYSLDLARHQSTGLYDLNNHYQNSVLSGHVALSPAPSTDIRLSVRYGDSKFNYPTNGAGVPGDSNAFRTETRTLLGVEIERRISQALKATLALNSSATDGVSDNQVDAPGGSSLVIQDAIRRRSGELRLQALPWSNTTVTVGAQVEQQDQRTQTQGAFGSFTFNSLFDAARRDVGVYAELVVMPIEQITATIGARSDKNEKFGTFGTSRIGLSWRPIEGTRLRATAGSAFREPTFAENFSTGFPLGNPGLQVERTRSAEIGIEQDVLRGRMSLAVTGFAQRFRNLIDFTNGTTACGFNYCNVADVRSNGVEGEVRGTIVRGLEATAGVTVLQTRVLSAGFDSSTGGLYKQGETLIRRPEHTWLGELSYRGRGPLSASARLTAVGQRTDRNFKTFPSTPVVLAPYKRLDVGAEYALDIPRMRRSALTLRVENLLNAYYESVFNYLTPRRVISVGVRAAF